MNGFDSIIFIGYGAPDKGENVPEFLRIVAGGFSISEERIKEVEEHYMLVGGGSPLNELTRRQGEGMSAFLKQRGVNLPVYMGMRNWHPFTDDTVAEMKRDGRKKCIALITALHQCDTSWERYQREVESAKKKAGADIEFVYPPPLFDHPLFIENCADRVAEQIARLPEGKLSDAARLIFTAHSIPLEMPGAETYVEQFRKTCELTAQSLGAQDFITAWQSRSGSPNQAWFEPDVCDVIRELRGKATHVVIQPVGFLCDHVEVLFDIGMEAAAAAEEANITMLRASTVNDDPKFIRALGETVMEVIECSDAKR